MPSIHLERRPWSSVRQKQSRKTMIPTPNVCSAPSTEAGRKLQRQVPGPWALAPSPWRGHLGLTVWLAPHATSRTTTLGTGRICPSFVFSMKMATRRGTSSQSYSIRCARAMNFPSELCPAASRAGGQRQPRHRAQTPQQRAEHLPPPGRLGSSRTPLPTKAAISNLRHSWLVA